ncbi:MAG: sugar transferase [Fimbriimonadaceae bacterium]|nr:MAG: sugar transferase [Fimbriimonadaceae bacterium]
MKRGFDIVASGIGLVVLFPVFLVISLIVMLGDGAPIFYKQKRIGLRGEIFWIYKFRSMRKDSDAILKELLATNDDLRVEFEETYKLKNDPRLIKFGDFLRKSSLDELPQLLNVFLGHMSLVGPRPIVPNEAYKYGNVFEVYKRMKPGCAGLWQCSGRNDTTYQERVNLDNSYYQSATFGGDIWVLMSTIKSLVRAKGAY